MTLSLLDLDLQKPCDIPFEFEYIPESTGRPSGVFISVLGGHSEKVKAWTRKSLNLLRQREAILTKKGKDEPRLVEDDEQFSIDMAAIRITAWRGITEDCTPENATKLCTVNPDIRAQVIKQSDELANFIMSKPKN
jgi:hypothetical protein